MLYQHTPENQEILQEAVKLRNRQESDADIALHGGLERAKMTVQRFRTADLRTYFLKSGRLKLDYRVADRLWKYCRKEIEAVIRERGDLQAHSERIAANALNSFYRVHESQTRKWKDEDGLLDNYFCYKPSFRRPGHVIKSQFNITLREGEYFRVDELQSDVTSRGGLKSTERSEGFGFSKSGRLWIFMREQSREQPRVFCFHKKDIDEDNRIAALFGYVLESDRRFSGGVFNFKVGLTSLKGDAALWEHLHPGEPYVPSEQIDNVRLPKKSVAGNSKSNSRVIFDPDILRYIKPDVIAGVDADALD